VVLKCRINALNHFISLSVSFMCPKRKMNATCFCLICKFVDIKVIVYYYSSHKSKEATLGRPSGPQPSVRDTNRLNPENNRELRNVPLPTVNVMLAPAT